MTRKRRRRRRQRRDAQGRRERGVPTVSPRGPGAPGRGRREAHPTGVRGRGWRRRLTSRRRRALAESDAAARRPCVTNVPPSSPGVTPRRQVGVGDGWSRDPGRCCAPRSLGAARGSRSGRHPLCAHPRLVREPRATPPAAPRPPACTAVRLTFKRSYERIWRGGGRKRKGCQVSTQ